MRAILDTIVGRISRHLIANSASKKFPHLVPIRWPIADRHCEEEPGYEIDDSCADDKKNDVQWSVPTSFFSQKAITADRTNTVLRLSAYPIEEIDVLVSVFRVFSGFNR